MPDVGSRTCGGNHRSANTQTGRQWDLGWYWAPSWQKSSEDFMAELADGFTYVISRYKAQVCQAGDTIQCLSELRDRHTQSPEMTEMGS